MLIVFSLNQIFSYYRFELFGIMPGYAPHNFAYNFGFFLPINTFCYIFINYINFNFKKLGKIK